jgi:hypothetical protein
MQQQDTRAGLPSREKRRTQLDAIRRSDVDVFL